MNILILATHLNFGGIASYVLNLARELKKNGHNVFVGSSGGDLEKELLNLGIVHLGLNIRTKSELSPKILFSFFKLKKLIRENSIQLIHAQTRVTQVLAYLLSKSLGIPYLATCHGYFKARFSRRVFACWGEKVIAISEAVKKHLVDDFKVSNEKVRLVYNGIKIGPRQEFNRKDLRKKLGLKDAPVVGIVARLSPVKGHKYLIEAMRYVVNTKPQAQLLIVGDGPSKEALSALTEKLNLKENIIFLRPRQNLEELFALMDVYVSPSLQEGLGLAILEAQANYVPVVAFATGGIKDIIRHEINGLLVRSFVIKELAGAILKLILDEELARRLKKEAYNFVAENFSVETMAEKTLDVYREVLE
ncbi:MAG: glycosyltransferase family 4 protein [Candidatus Omnitrophota bacterium]|nr:glycosyltransferase family 4 protein [Candidatus Omnitrophota bacterium]